MLVLVRLHCTACMIAYHFCITAIPTSNQPCRGYNGSTYSDTNCSIFQLLVARLPLPKHKPIACNANMEGVLSCLLAMVVQSTPGITRHACSDGSPLHMTILRVWVMLSNLLLPMLSLTSVANNSP